MIKSWQRVAIGKMCKFKYGQMPKKNQLFDKGYPVFSGYRVVGYSNTYHYKEPTIIVVARGVGGAGDVKMSPPECFLTNLSIAIQITSPYVNQLFLFYRLSGTGLWDLRTGSAQAQITIDRLNRYEIDLPPLPTQRKIAAILSAYDDLIENNLRRIKILEEMAQNLYREWFVKFRFPGYEKVKFVDSPLGMIPEKWEVTTLGDYCSLTMGQSPKSEYYNDVGNGLPFHQGVSDFGYWHPSDRLYCSVDNRIAEANDILFSVRAPVGRMNFTNKKIIIGRGLSAIRAKNSAQSFLWEQLHHKFTKVDMIGNGAIFASVTKNDMQRITILSPTDSVLEKVSQYLVPLHNQISCLVRKNDSIRNQRDHLLPKLISGKVDVSDLDIEVPEEVIE
jgi:type I restriction enzyme S subunit